MQIVQTVQHNPLVVIIILAFAFYVYSNWYKGDEGLDNVSANASVPMVAPDATASVTTTTNTVTSKVNLPISTIITQAPPLTSTDQQNQVDKIVAGKTQLTTSDLLPKYDAADEFVKQNPTAKILQDQNFLQAGYHMGINTVVQSNKIPYLDLRSLPPIPKSSIGPWNQSSYDENSGSNSRRGFEIGV